MKRLIEDTNPLLEALGNAKTVRNDNSSRFGKYLELQFNSEGSPVGGTTSTFLLEKTRVAFQNRHERNFHIFYQFIYGADPALKQELGCECDPSYFNYLSQSGCMHVSSVDDVADYRATRSAMGLIGINEGTQVDIFRLLAGILHVGNVQFQGNAPAQVVDPTPLQTAAYLFSVSPEQLAHALVHRKIQSGSARSTQYAVQQNSDQAYGIRDALAKTVYERLFNWVVEQINQSMACTSAGLKCLGVLDIYGFEVFEKNGFEQLCINYVNEKLQQVYVKLKLKEEQAEYANEGLKWKPVDYHDNEVTCTLIDGKQPPGLMRILDDTCRSAHAVDSNKADYEFLNKMYQAMGENKYLTYTQESFTIQHYAGPVEYNIDQFAFKNKDSLFLNLVELIQMSQNPFIASLFPDDTSSKINKGPSTAGFKIRESAGYLMKRLSSCTPHFLRTIKSNDKKESLGWNSRRVEHQVQYLGLLESVRVSKAGFSYRHMKDVFLRRFGELVSAQGCRSIDEFSHWLRSAHPEYNGEIVEGRTKVFVKSAELIYTLEEDLFKKNNPEEYKLQQKEFNRAQKQTAGKMGKGSYGMQSKCSLM